MRTDMFCHCESQRDVAIPRVHMGDRRASLAMTIIVFSIFYSTLFFPFSIFASETSPLYQIKTNPQLQKELQAWVSELLEEWEGKKENLKLPTSNVFQKPLAVFVTAKKGNEVRGCMGTLRPREKNLAEEIRTNLRLAFSRDPRHRPVQKDEVAEMEIYISSVSNPKLVSELSSLDPARDAVMIKSGSREAVALPGEAKTLRYLLAFLKSKAGIHRGENFQLYRMESETVEVMLPSSRS